MIKEIPEVSLRVQVPTSCEISHGYLDMEVKEYHQYLKTFHNY